MSTAAEPPLAAGTRRPARTLLALALVLAVLAILLPPGSGHPATSPVPLVVEGTSAAAAAAVLGEHGGTEVVQLEQFSTAFGLVAAARVDAVRADPRVRSVTTDRGVALAGATHIDDAPATLSARTIGAGELWDRGVDGTGVTVAVVDTGIAPHPAVRDRVVAVLDVSGEDDAAAPDGHGHGTFMAGLVAGGGSQPTGIAPGAELVAVKVANRDGATSLTRVLAGLHAVAQVHEELSIDVALLALASEWPGQRDPLDAAIERLWELGIVVVTAAGNEGPHEGTVVSPGRNPTVLTAGALDVRGTAARADDAVPAWSSAGSSDLPAKPELVAPAVSVVSLRVPDSVIDEAFPDARVEDDRFRGSGTSMAAAVAAGAVALVLDAQPSLSPDEVKATLLGAAAPAPADASPAQVGAGALDLRGIEPAADGPAAGEPAGDPGPRATGPQSRASGPGAGPPSAEPAAWTWKAWTWKAWTWQAWTWKAWTWKAWTWKAWTWKAWTWRAWTWR